MRSVILSLVAIGSAPLLAWTQSPTPKPPIFDAQADLVLVDVVVADRKQRPVLDLVKSDFRVFEDGVERNILSFVAFGAAAAKALGQIDPDRFGDRSSPPIPFVPASTVVMIDEGHLALADTVRLRPGLSQVTRELNERQGWVLVLAPWSNVAFAGRLPGDLAMITEAVNHVQGRRTPQFSTIPMTDSEAIDIERGDTQALARLAARISYLNPGVSESAADIARTRATELSVEARSRRGDTFAAMRQGFAWLSRQPGRHTFLLVTSGFAFDPADPGFIELINESLRVNAPIHFLDVSSASPFGAFEGIQYKHALGPEARVSSFESTDSAAGSDQLTVNTGGIRFGENDIDRGLKRLMDSTRLYYILGYEPPVHRKAGFRKIKVELRGKRKGVQIRARRGYYGAATPAQPPAIPLPSPSNN